MEPEPAEELEQPAHDETDDALEDVAGAAKIYLEQWSKEFGSWAKCTHYTAADFSTETVREHWGPGRYRVRVKDEHGHFNGKPREFVVAGAPGQLAGGGAARGLAQAPAPSFANELLEQLLKAQLARLAEPAPAMNWTGIATAAGTFLSGLTPLLVAAWGNRKDPIETATKIAELVNANKAPATPPVQANVVLEILERGMRLGAARRGNGDGDGKGFGATLLEVVPQLIELVKQDRQANPPADTSAPPEDAASATPPALALVKPAAEGAEMDVAALVKGIAPVVLQWYAVGKDPAESAHVLLFNMADGAVDQLAEFSDRPEFLAAPFILAPELEQARPWVTKLLEAIREELKPEDEATPAGGGT